MSNVGITSIGAYIPYYTMDRNVIAKAWGARGLKGERSMANSDEDSVTMAVEAAMDCFRFVDRKDIGALYFASTTAPYAEKSHASLIATVCNLSQDVFTADFAHSTRSGTSALKAAVDAVSAQSSGQALVTAADCRNAYPKSSQEQLFGDAAAAVVIGTENVIAEVVCFSTINNEITDVWRNSQEKFINNAEQRFVTEKGYMTAMSLAVKDALKKAGLAQEDISKVVFTTPGFKENLQLAKKLGFAETQLQDNLMMKIGDCGTAQPLLLLAATLEEAKPDDKILLASYGNGADVFVFTVTPNIKMIQRMSTIRKYLENRKKFEDYGRFLSFRGILTAVPGEPYKIPASTAMYWREQDTYLRFLGSKCKKCGTEIFPINRVCHQCGVKDEYEVVRKSGRTAKVFTYSIDKLAGRSDDPIVVQTIAEDQEGARYYLNMTDFEQSEVKIGMEVEFTFRKIHTLGDFNNYYWKFRPIRKHGGVEL